MALAAKVREPMAMPWGCWFGIVFLVSMSLPWVNLDPVLLYFAVSGLRRCAMGGFGPLLRSNMITKLRNYSRDIPWSMSYICIRVLDQGGVTNEAVF